MNITVAPCADLDDLQGALGAIWHYFGVPFTAEDRERFGRLLGPARMHAARDGGRIVGGAGAYEHELTVPGGTVRAAGITVVGVLPTHRRRGVLRAMMRAQLDAVRERGEPVAWLWASEETIYTRFGYGMASLGGEVDLPRTHTAFARPFTPRGSLRLVEVEEAAAVFPPIYDRVRRRTPGMLARSDDWWKLRRLADPESRRGGGGPMQRILLELDGEPRGYALYRVHSAMSGGVPSGHVSVIEAIGATAEATAEIWHCLLNIDWIARVKASLLPPDHPLFFLLGRPRLMQFVMLDAVWVRLVDIPAALAARALGSGEPVVVEVADPFCPWNAGRYRIGAAAGGAERTTAAADLELEVNALGSVYLGGFTFGQLLRAGAIAERTPGAAARADAIFPRDLAPWCPEIF